MRKGLGARVEGVGVKLKKKFFDSRKSGEKQENDDVNVQMKSLGSQLFFTLWTENWVNFPDSITTLMYD